MIEIVKKYNSETLLVKRDDELCVFKRFPTSDPETLSALLTVRDPNVAGILGTEVMDDGFYIVMEYIEGVTLESYVRDKGTLTYKETVRIAEAVCDGLTAFHKRGLVHRDINPSNIMIDSYDKVKIIDFGICRIYSDEKTADTQLLGTPGFASPEQYGFGQSGYRSDIYSVGVLINYMQTGLLPSEKLVSGRLRKVVKCCTQVDEKKRYPDVASLKNVLRFGFPGGKSRVPGFRENVTWHKIVALIYYILLLFLYLLQISVDKTAWHNFTWFISVTVVFVIPELVAVNFLNWSDKLKFTYSFKKWQLVLFHVVAGLLVLFLLILLIPNSWYYDGT